MTLPGDAKSFALIYSIEDPSGSNGFSGVGAQVMGPDDGYLIQYSKDVSSFWADRNRLALGSVFRRKDPGGVVGSSGYGLKGMIPKERFLPSCRRGISSE